MIIFCNRKKKVDEKIELNSVTLHWIFLSFKIDKHWFVIVGICAKLYAIKDLYNKYITNLMDTHSLAVCHGHTDVLNSLDIWNPCACHKLTESRSSPFNGRQNCSTFLWIDPKKFKQICSNSPLHGPLSHKYHAFFYRIQLKW